MDNEYMGVNSVGDLLSYWRYTKHDGVFKYGEIYVWGYYEMRGGSGWERVKKADYEKAHQIKEKSDGQ